MGQAHHRYQPRRLCRRLGTPAVKLLPLFSAGKSSSSVSPLVLLLNSFIYIKPNKYTDKLEGVKTQNQTFFTFNHLETFSNLIGKLSQIQAGSVFPIGSENVSRCVWKTFPDAPEVRLLRVFDEEEEIFVQSAQFLSIVDSDGWECYDELFREFSGVIYCINMFWRGACHQFIQTRQACK